MNRQSLMTAFALALVVSGPAGAEVGPSKLAAGLDLGTQTYNRELVADYAPDSILRRLGRPVGRIDILTDKGVFPCTAFLVEGDMLITNQHCIPGILDNTRIEATRIEAVQFIAGYLDKDNPDDVDKYVVNPEPLESIRELDYTLLQVFGRPTETYGSLPLTDKVPGDDAPLWLIGHPMGEVQRISREKCRTAAPAVSNDRLLHTCDVLPGDSAAPLIDPATGRVVALHHAGSKRDSVNFAVPMAEILARSAYLKTTPDAEPDANLNRLLDALADSDPQALTDALVSLRDTAPDDSLREKAKHLLELLP